MHVWSRVTVSMHARRAQCPLQSADQHPIRTQDAQLRSRGGAALSPATPASTDMRAAPALGPPVTPAPGAQPSDAQAAAVAGGHSGTSSVPLIAGVAGGAAVAFAAIAAAAGLFIRRASLRRRADAASKAGASKWPAAGLGVAEGRREVVTDSAYQSGAWDSGGRGPRGGSSGWQGALVDSQSKSWLSCSLSSVPSSAPWWHRREVQLRAALILLIERRSKWKA